MYNGILIKYIEMYYRAVIYKKGTQLPEHGETMCISRFWIVAYTISKVCNGLHNIFFGHHSHNTNRGGTVKITKKEFEERKQEDLYYANFENESRKNGKG